MSLEPNAPVTYLITPGTITSENFLAARAVLLDRIRLAADLGISMVQIREKALPVRRLCELAADVLEITHKTRTKLLINDRADVAAAIGADGVHLTANSLASETVRTWLGDHIVIGVSVHSKMETVQAASGGADFAVFAPVFASPGKGKPKGPEALADLCREVDPFPVLALGGVDETNYGEVLDAGAAGFAAIRALNTETSMRSILTTLAGRI